MLAELKVDSKVLSRAGHLVDVMDVLMVVSMVALRASMRAAWLVELMAGLMVAALAAPKAM
jgi:hypothetical protein